MGQGCSANRYGLAYRFALFETDVIPGTQRIHVHFNIQNGFPFEFKNGLTVAAGELLLQNIGTNTCLRIDHTILAKHHTRSRDRSPLRIDDRDNGFAWLGFLTRRGRKEDNSNEREYLDEGFHECDLMASYG